MNKQIKTLLVYDFPDNLPPEIDYYLVIINAQDDSSYFSKAFWDGKSFWFDSKPWSLIKGTNIVAYAHARKPLPYIGGNNACNFETAMFEWEQNRDCDILSPDRVWFKSIATLRNITVAPLLIGMTHNHGFYCDDGESILATHLTYEEMTAPWIVSSLIKNIETGQG